MAQTYGTDPLPSPAEALAEPFSAFPSWFLRIECDRCGTVVMLSNLLSEMRLEVLGGGRQAVIPRRR